MQVLSYFQIYNQMFINITFKTCYVQERLTQKRHFTSLLTIVQNNIIKEGMFFKKHHYCTKFLPLNIKYLNLTQTIIFSYKLFFKKF